MGDARNVAVRLKEVAVAGQVICTEATHRLFRGQFQSQPLGSKKIKGVAGRSSSSGWSGSRRPGVVRGGLAG